MNFLAHLHLADLAESSLSGNLLADFVRGNPEESFPPTSWLAFICIDVSTDICRKSAKHGNGFVVKLAALRLLRWMSCGITFFPPLVAAVAGLSATGICLLCPRASDDDFAGLTATFYQSEQLLVVRAVAGALSRYGFHPERVNGMASRRPRLDALRDSWTI